MNFDADEFHEFSKALRIDSKERGLMSLGDNLLGSQAHLLKEIQLGFQEGVREFVTLKARQLGASTLSLALDLYWVNKYKGMNGALVTHDEGSRDQFRTTLELYRSGLGETWQREVLDDNRNQLVLENGSRLSFRVAGTSKRAGGSKLGRSGALALGHMTECAFYGDAQNIDSLRSSFAELNPVRFYHWESTANGFNHFHGMYQEAKKAQTMRAIFLSWWHNEFYRVGRDSDLYRVYWGERGRMTAEEKEWVAEVKSMYRETIDPEQIAWYRYMAAEKITDEDMLRQEFPCTEEMAWIATGSAFFRAKLLGEVMKVAKASEPESYRVETGPVFTRTRVIPVKERLSTLRVWDGPVDGATYVLGCDPAYASSEWADFSAISVWRCWYNRIEQVAEFASREIPTHAVAWVLAYLAGFYGKTSVNIEVNGPGVAVLAELNNLKRSAHSRFEGDAPEAVRQVVRYMRQFVYRRIDVRSAGSTLLHTKTTYEIKERMMNGMRDYVERGMAVVRSVPLVSEMETIVREGSSAPGAPQSKNDDRVIAAALAIMCWNDQMRMKLLNEGVIWEVDKPEPVIGRVDVAAHLVQNYFRSIGVLNDMEGIPEPRKKASARRPRWTESRAGGNVVYQKERV